ncbi:hypothetical protein HY477_01650 [Candidatus Uhrbacteria bacterium]|nr:hypothetical protein [Candidatus Uhrbacteria bacterium]
MKKISTPASTALRRFIKKRKYLIWYTENFDNLPASSIVEATLNYGNWDDVQKLIKILGIKEVARIFRAQNSLRWGRTNYHPKTAQFFKLYFTRHA